MGSMWSRIHSHRLLAQIEQRAKRTTGSTRPARYLQIHRARLCAAIDTKISIRRPSERVGKYTIHRAELGCLTRRLTPLARGYYTPWQSRVERDIINAPYKIDAKASSELNRHPVAGFDILSPIHHPYADIPLISKYHHERLDGTGYPDGLVGDEIPFGARIVALADSFDAMTTDRPYKTRRSLKT